MAMLKSLAGLHRLVDSHLRCPGCDYDLKGLRYGGKCPECGAPIRPPVLAGRSINDAPIVYLKRLRVGVFSLLTGVLALPFAIACLFLSGSLAASLFFVTVVVSTAWCIGVYILTAPIPAHAQEAAAPANTALRVATCVLTASWFLVLGVPFVWRLGVPFPGIALYLVWVCATIGAGAGFTLLSTYVARLAAWANDMDLGHMMRGASVAVGLLALAFLALTTLSILGVPANILLFFYLGGGLVALGVAGWNVYLYLRFATLLAWAPSNARNAIERARVRGERVAQRIVDAQAKPEPIPQFDVVKPPVHGMFVPPTNAGTIDLAPDSETPAPPKPASSGKATIQADAALPPLPKRKPAPAPDVNRKKDEMI